MVETVTKDWFKQQQAEIRHAGAAEKRMEQLTKERTRPKRAAPAHPSGELGLKILSAAREADVSIDDLTVLSPNNDPYTAWRRRREAEWFAELFNRFVAAGATKHLRGFFYLLVSSRVVGPDDKPFINDDKHWQDLLRAAKAARWVGLIEFERIIDERNAASEIYVPGVTPISTSIGPGAGCEIPATAECALPGQALSGFVGRQSHRLIFYGEKSSLAAVLRPIAEEIGAEMILTTGESSDSYIAGMAKRASEDGRPAVVFYFSDFDPSGHQMPTSVSRKLQALKDLRYPSLDIKLYQVALTLEQVRELGLPSSPLKQTEKRASRWRQIHGHEQTEIDAMVELHPGALRAAVFDAIAPFYDADLARRVHEVAEEWRQKAVEALKAHPGYQDARERITDAWELASEAVEELHDQQRRAAEILADSVPPPPKLPAAEPKGEAEPPHRP
jgi:hypothetical protein